MSGCNIYVPIANVETWLSQTHRSNLILIEESTQFKDTIALCYHCLFVQFESDKQWYLIVPKYGFWSNFLSMADNDFYTISGPADSLDEIMTISYLTYRFINCEYVLQ